MLFCECSQDSASRRGMTKASPRTRCGVQKRTSETFIYGGYRLFTSCGIPLCGYSLDSASERGMTTYEKELQLPEALFVARPGYDPGTS